MKKIICESLRVLVPLTSTFIIYYAVVLNLIIAAWIVSYSGILC